MNKDPGVPMKVLTRECCQACEDAAKLCDSNARQSRALLDEQPHNSYAQACAAEAESLAIAIRSSCKHMALSSLETVRVPREPTKEMLQAAFDAPKRGHPETAGQSYRDIYKAMLSAAPSEQAPEVEKLVEELDETVNASLAATATNPSRLNAMQQDCRAQIAKLRAALVCKVSHGGRND